MPSISLPPLSRRSFIASSLATTAGSFLSGSILTTSSAPILAQETKGILSAVKMAGLKLYYDFELDSISLTFRINFSDYFPIKDLSTLDLNAFDTASDMLPLENLLPGFIANNNNSDFTSAMNFFNPGHNGGIPFKEIEEIENENIGLLAKILEEQKSSGEKVPIRGAKYIFEKTGEALLRILDERGDLIKMVTSSKTPQFAGKGILNRAFIEGPDFLQKNLWFKLNQKKQELEDRVSRLKASQPNSLEHRRVQEEFNDTNSAIDKMNGTSQLRKIPKNICTTLSIISPIRNLSLNLEEKCKDENIELVLIKKEDSAIGFIYSNSKGIIEFVKPEILKKIDWRQNEDRMIISFEKGSKSVFIEAKLKDLYC